MSDVAPFVASTIRLKVVQVLIEENERGRGNRNVQRGDIVYATLVLPLLVTLYFSPALTHPLVE
jgi:hypothetical protein